MIPTDRRKIKGAPFLAAASKVSTGDTTVPSDLPITAIRFASSGASRFAYYDPLTHLLNRGLMQRRLERALKACAHTCQFGALFHINIDNFKSLNEMEGHSAGDLILIEVASRLVSALREGHAVARQWGDDFLILAEDLGDSAEQATAHAGALGERLISAITKTICLEGFDYQCHVGVGVSLFQQVDTVESVFKHSGMALKESKKTGNNALCFFELSMQSVLEHKASMIEELKKALLWQQFRTYYQPQVNSSKQVIGVEALIRWQHPVRGLIFPGEFIPLAEESNLIVPIGLWVLQSACAQLKTWETDPLTSHLQIAVNVSARQFHQADFVDQIRRTLDLSAANPTRLKLELTESLVLDNIDDVTQKMNEIRQFGVSFSLDDFGTGYSSLAYLAHLPLDQLKIDKSFVQSIPGKSSDEIVTRTIIDMGHRLGLNVIAEGIETDVQKEFLALHGCLAFQGFLFSRPLPIDQFEAYLRLSSSLAVWDATTLSNMVGTDADINHRMLSMFVRDATQQVRAIELAVAAGDLALAAKLAHELKTSARMVGALQMGQLCEDIETAGDDADVMTCSSLSHRLGPAFMCVKALIQLHIVPQEPT
jgi:diguanylate cyclase (GGDEF)-like protein